MLDRETACETDRLTGLERLCEIDRQPVCETDCVTYSQAELERLWETDRWLGQVDCDTDRQTDCGVGVEFEAFEADLFGQSEDKDVREPDRPKR